MQNNIKICGLFKKNNNANKHILGDLSCCPVFEISSRERKIVIVIVINLVGKLNHSIKI